MGLAETLGIFFSLGGPCGPSIMNNSGYNYWIQHVRSFLKYIFLMLMVLQAYESARAQGSYAEIESLTKRMKDKDFDDWDYQRKVEWINKGLLKTTVPAEIYVLKKFLFEAAYSEN